MSDDSGKRWDERGNSNYHQNMEWLHDRDQAQNAGAPGGGDGSIIGPIAVFALVGAFIFSMVKSWYFASLSWISIQFDVSEKYAIYIGIAAVILVLLAFVVIRKPLGKLVRKVGIKRIWVIFACSWFVYQTADEPHFVHFLLGGCIGVALAFYWKFVAALAVLFIAYAVFFGGDLDFKPSPDKVTKVSVDLGNKNEAREITNYSSTLFIERQVLTARLEIHKKADTRSAVL